MSGEPGPGVRLRRLGVAAETYLNLPAGAALGRALRVRNRESTLPVTGGAPVVVSLTSHGARIDSVHLAIESIAAGSLRPRRLILWLDDAERFQQLTPGLIRLRARGLEVRLTPGLGPYTKFYPTLAELAEEDLLVTADDDVLYPRDWLARLLAAHEAEPHLVHCYRARDIVLDGDGFAPYSRWRLTTSRAPGFHRFATGVSGVVYPRAVIDALIAAGSGFTEKAPRADDVWLHFVTVLSGTRVRQLSAQPRHFPVVPGSQRTTLYSDNLFQNGNDPQIAATYTPEAIERIRADIEAADRR